MNKGLWWLLSSLLIGLGIVIRLSAITSVAVTISYAVIGLGFISLIVLAIVRTKS
jgi:uncharacterized membrane-anchored protein